MVPTKIRGNWCMCLTMIPLILLLLWLLMPMLSDETTTTTMPIAPEEPTRSCSIYGDPHAMTFDGMHQDFYTSGEFWIVKSADVSIQARYAPTHATNGLAVTKQIAVSGPFLKGHKLIVGEEHAFYDGAPILTGFPSQFSSPDGLVSIVYNSQGESLQPGREGKTFHVLHVTLPGRVSMQINRWNEAGEGRYINAKITMPPQAGGQDGDCGNFNGNPADDKRLLVRSRLGKEGVAAAELLLDGPKTPVNLDLENCADHILTNAHESCKAVSPDFWPKMECLVQVCNGGIAS
jgi:hypothetical protein